LAALLDKLVQKVLPFEDGKFFLRPCDFFRGNRRNEEAGESPNEHLSELEE
jgi:hypothetical protein